MMRKIWMLLACLMLVTGASLFLYPVVTQWLSDRENHERIEEFEQELEKKLISEEGTFTEIEKEPDSTLQQLYADMQTYNQNIFENGQENLKDPFSYEEKSFDLTQWNADDMFGYLIIPRMKLDLPIYLGASKENMAKGAVHMSQTSLPIGGKNTNGVIAAHRGWPTSAMFREIEKLKVGDQVQIRNFWGTLTYEVSEIKIILPNEVNQVLIQENRDLITLMTCHPYTKNYQRYVVYCERVGQDEAYPKFAKGNLEE